MHCFTIEHYKDAHGTDYYARWYEKLMAKKPQIAAKVYVRVNRVAEGNFGDHRACREGVCELRIDVGAGYRVYYAIDGKTVVLLLCGGDKSTQDADIDRACKYWKDWQRNGRNKE